MTLPEESNIILLEKLKYASLGSYTLTEKDIEEIYDEFERLVNREKYLYDLVYEMEEFIADNDLEFYDEVDE